MGGLLMLFFRKKERKNFNDFSRLQWDFTVKFIVFSESFWDFTLNFSGRSLRSFYDVLFLDHDLFKKLLRCSISRSWYRFKKIRNYKTFWDLCFSKSQEVLIILGLRKSASIILICLRIFYNLDLFKNLLWCSISRSF